VVSFGLFDGTVGQLREPETALGRNAQVDRIGPQVQEVRLDGSFEIVEEISA
jgi:hypothetical protein